MYNDIKISLEDFISFLNSILDVTNAEKVFDVTMKHLSIYSKKKKFLEFCNNMNEHSALYDIETKVWDKTKNKWIIKIED